MSISSIESKIRSLQSEVERLSRELEREGNKEVGYLKDIQRMEKSVNKNTSITQMKLKQHSIDSDNEKIFKSRRNQTDINVKINKKRMEISKAQIELQKEQTKLYDVSLNKQNSIIEEQRQIINEIKVLPSSSTNANTTEKKEYDFFISHASEDKEAIAEPLATSLIDKGAKVWYDKFTLKVGDSLRKSIDNGLANSRYGIVILSEPYFKKFWTGEELNGLFAKQEDGKKVILPLWHKVSKDVVKENSPIFIFYYFHRQWLSI
jgi:hypothetical protein